MNKKKRQADYEDCHHMIPQKRGRALGIDVSDTRNLKYGLRSIHQAHHRLWGQLFPWEILATMQLMNRVFRTYNGRQKDDWLLLYRSTSIEQAIAVFTLEWTPPKAYFNPANRHEWRQSCFLQACVANGLVKLF